ncbi:MAG: glycosyltransferase [Bacteroidota bacterium]
MNATIPHIGVISDPNHFHTKKWVNGLLRAGVKVTLFGFAEEHMEGVAYVRISPQAFINGQISYLSYLFSGRSLRKALVKSQVDVLLALHVTPYGVWALRSRFQPLVLMAMGADILEYPPRFEQLQISQDRTYNSQSLSPMKGTERAVSKGWSKMKFRLRWRFFRYWVNRSLQAGCFIAGDNQQLVDSVINWFNVPKEKVQLNRWGIEASLFQGQEAQARIFKEKWGIEKGKKVILAPRGLKPVYQGDIILEAIESYLKLERDTYHFIVLSAGYQAPEEVERRAILLDESQSNFTYIKGLIPREHMGALWELTDGMIIAPVYDGYSNALNEGKYTGALPILNDIPAHREMMTHQQNAWLIKDFDKQRLVDTLLALEQDFESWKQKFALHNRAWVQEHASLDTNIKKFLEGMAPFVRLPS